MTAKQKQAYEWAKNQRLPSAAAHIAIPLIEIIDDQTTLIASMEHDLMESTGCMYCAKKRSERCKNNMTMSASMNTCHDCIDYEYRGPKNLVEKIL